MNYFEYRKTWGCIKFKEKSKSYREKILLKNSILFLTLFAILLLGNTAIYYYFSYFSFLLTSAVSSLIFFFSSFKIMINYVKSVLFAGQNVLLTEKDQEDISKQYGQDFLDYLKNNDFILNVNLLLIIEREYLQFKNEKETQCEV